LSCSSRLGAIIKDANNALARFVENLFGMGGAMLFCFRTCVGTANKMGEDNEESSEISKEIFLYKEDPQLLQVVQVDPDLSCKQDYTAAI
jgi:hypothetical protein